MTFPKMTSKRWFWFIMAFGVLWSVAGWRWGGGQGDNPQGRLLWMAAVQNGLSQPIETAAIPPSFVLTTVQTTLADLVRPGIPSGLPENSDSLRQRILDLENENAQLKQLIGDANGRLAAMRFLQAYRIEAGDVLPATVVGFQAGPGSAILRLDKGSAHGVKPGDAVVAALEHVHVVGRVEKKGLGQFECTVRLITDPTTTIQAQIVRPMVQSATATQPYQNLAVTNDLCLVQGQGNGRMHIANVDTVDAVSGRPIRPQKGDLVLLTDGTWPAKVQHMVVGQVDAVGPKEDQLLRYDIGIVPRISFSAQRNVMILVRD
jgi:hypothetical protein